MPFDDDAEADNTGFRPPPHPDDRLWRHPSEMDAHPIVPIGAPAGRLVMAANPTHSGRWSGRPWGAVVLAGSVGALLAGVTVMVLRLGERVVERPVTERVAVDSSASALGGPGALTADGVRERVAPAVTGIGATGSEGGRADVAGSGVIVRDDGIVVTSAALVTAGAQPTVRLPDGTVVEAEVVGSDPVTDLAVLELADAGDHTTSVLAEAAGLVAGERVFALNALADEGTTTTAGVAGSTRRYLGPTGRAFDGVEIEGDADPLALGGPVVDERGAVVGIVNAVDDGASWYVTPVEVVHRVVDELLTAGSVRHCWLGIEGTDSGTSDTDGTAGASSITPRTGGGAEVASVVPDSPAAAGGLGAGDLIVALDGQPVTHMPDLIVALRARSPGDRVDVTVTRDDGSRTTLVLTLAEAPEPPT